MTGGAVVQGRFNHAVSAAFRPILCLVALSAPASAQEVTLSDLEGLVIEADIHREQEVRRQGGTRLVRIHQNWKLSVDADKTLEFTLNTSIQARGVRRRISMCT